MTTDPGRAGDALVAEMPGLDTIVRFHDVQRLPELRRCIFSLVGQRYRPLNVILAVQRFTPAQIEEVRAALAPTLAIRNAPGLEIVNWEARWPRDARSELLNLGMSAARGRFLAFLDYDDVLYPEAYELIVARMRATGAAIGFASVRVLRADLYDRFHHARGVAKPFNGSSLLDLFRANFCPLHSYVIDRGVVPTDVLRFDTSSSWEEDYEVLLKICARFPSDFSLVGTAVGDYLYKNDGSNTVPTDGEVPKERLAEYEHVRARVERRRAMTEVSAEVQRSLGIPAPVPGLTIRDVLCAARDGKLASVRRPMRPRV